MHPCLCHKDTAKGFGCLELCLYGIRELNSSISFFFQLIFAQRMDFKKISIFLAWAVFTFVSHFSAKQFLSSRRERYIQALIGRDPSRLCSDWLDHDVADVSSLMP